MKESAGGPKVSQVWKVTRYSIFKHLLNLSSQMVEKQIVKKSFEIEFPQSSTLGFLG